MQNQMRQTADDGPRLSATRSGQDQQRPFGVKNGFSLRGIEGFEEVHGEELIVAQCLTATDQSAKGGIPATSS